ncbi:DEAD/DEAH box helicase [bacterium]|nr:DEAD/DEAH box helicase [bacterium]
MTGLLIDRSSTGGLIHSELIQTIGILGYSRVPMVLEPGEFSVRGGIVDVFPVNHSHPIRFDFDGDHLDRLNSFNIRTQRSISSVQTTTIQPVADETDLFFHASVSGHPSTVLDDLRDGDFVVHELYGVGCFKGLVRLTLGQREGEYLFVQYKGQDKLYVPLEHVHLITRYSAADVVPTLNGLHDGEWKKTTSRTKKALEELAHDVYLMAKVRQESSGFSFQEDTIWQVDLEARFMHTDTDDQRRVTHEVKRDMESDRPMDRLICGDVGFGKTEILVRAAFKAVENKKQVAVVVPTTILAEQHFRTFCARFMGFPYRIDSLSRFKTRAQQRETIQSLKRGDVHVVIGTHRLFSKDVVFKDLGLVIVDEEQRFGVTHKERLKQLKNNVDVLSVSATPIPRTLYLALMGSRGLSKLTTAPTQRKPVATLVHAYNELVIEQAIRNELDRGGQVYYLYNHVRHIHSKVAMIRQWVDPSIVGVAHGQMDEKTLESTMTRFWSNEIRVLVCSTIIENGMDLPSANTIIIEDADRLGLSQIHQLRGRVGRGEVQGFAVLLYRSEETISPEGTRRLDAIREYAALGSGYQLAMKDLEIRGAGSLLGKKQSGHVTAVGFELYCRMLDDAVARYNGKPVGKRKSWIEGSNLSLLVPDTYIVDPRERLAMYRRIVDVEFPFQLDDLSDELEDRYGEIPGTVLLLFDTIRHRLSQ